MYISNYHKNDDIKNQITTACSYYYEFIQVKIWRLFIKRKYI